MKSKLKCLHCLIRAMGQTRGLCNTCYRDLKIRYRYAPRPRDRTGSIVKMKSTADIHEALQDKWSKHPLWVPVPYPRDDPRFNMWIAARRDAGLPEFHPED